MYIYICVLPSVTVTMCVYVLSNALTCITVDLVLCLLHVGFHKRTSQYICQSYPTGNLDMFLNFLLNIYVHK